MFGPVGPPMQVEGRTASIVTEPFEASKVVRLAPVLPSRKMSAGHAELRGWVSARIRPVPCSWDESSFCRQSTSQHQWNSQGHREAAKYCGARFRLWRQTGQLSVGSHHPLPAKQPSTSSLISLSLCFLIFVMGAIEYLDLTASWRWNEMMQTRFDTEQKKP